MAISERIMINPKVMLGKPVIRGTRIPVELILRKLAEGGREEELLDAYPRLKRIATKPIMPPAAPLVKMKCVAEHRRRRRGGGTRGRVFLVLRACH